MPTGLVKLTIQASGAASRTRRAMSRTTGTVRSALASPPAPVVSWPTQPHSSGQVSSCWRAACPPTRSCTSTAATPSSAGSSWVVVVILAGWPRRSRIRRAERADQLEPFLGRVDQDQLLDRQQVTEPADPVDQLRCVRRPAADHRDPHPFTPVRVTPSMNARWAKKKRMITGAMTSRVAAIVRFQFVWWALLNVCSP